MKPILMMKPKPKPRLEPSIETMSGSYLILLSGRSDDVRDSDGYCGDFSCGGDGGGD